MPKNTTYIEVPEKKPLRYPTPVDFRSFTPSPSSGYLVNSEKFQAQEKPEVFFKKLEAALEGKHKKEPTNSNLENKDGGSNQSELVGVTPPFKPKLGSLEDTDGAKLKDQEHIKKMVALLLKIKRRTGEFRNKILVGIDVILKSSELNVKATKEMAIKDTKENQNSGKHVFIHKLKDREKLISKMMYTPNTLKDYAAYAGAIFDEEYVDTISKHKFLNLPGSLAKKKLFPGIELVEEKLKDSLSQFAPNTLGVSSSWNPKYSLGHYRVIDIKLFIDSIKAVYLAGGERIELHPIIEKRIREHVKKMKFILPKMAGIAGLHAEVQALNYILSQPYQGADNMYARLANTYIFTQRLVGAIKEDFDACANCSGILNGWENIMTGRVSNAEDKNRILEQRKYKKFPKGTQEFNDIRAILAKMD